MKNIKTFYQNLAPAKAVLTGILTFFLGNYAAGSVYAMGQHTDGIIMHILVTLLVFAHFGFLVAFNNNEV